jgi:hypothetical protein
MIRALYARKHTNLAHGLFAFMSLPGAASVLVFVTLSL